MKEPHPSDETIFAAALERPEVERAAYLEAACASDTELTARIESLLSAHDEAARFMATTAVKPPDQPGAVLTERSGDRIGRYKLLQKIGEGGCGVVYRGSKSRR